jgi:hypothetical protein
MAGTETRPVASIIVGSRFRKVTGDINALARSIADIGLLHPIAVTPDRRAAAVVLPFVDPTKPVWIGSAEAAKRSRGWAGRAGGYPEPKPAKSQHWGIGRDDD